MGKCLEVEVSPLDQRAMWLGMSLEMELEIQRKRMLNLEWRTGDSVSTWTRTLTLAVAGTMKAPVRVAEAKMSGNSVSPQRQAKD